MKKKFNFKLTALLVSLFLSLIIIILGNKNKYCLSFGFILLGFCAAFFVNYNNEKTDKQIQEIDRELDELDLSDGIDIDEDGEEDVITDEEKAYILQQLCLQQSNLTKRKKKVSITFYLCAAMLVLLGILGIF
jgi:hypothetical protein